MVLASPWPHAPAYSVAKLHQPDCLSDLCSILTHYLSKGTFWLHPRQRKTLLPRQTELTKDLALGTVRFWPSSLCRQRELSPKFFLFSFCFPLASHIPLGKSFFWTPQIVLDSEQASSPIYWAECKPAWTHRPPRFFLKINTHRLFRGKCAQG